MKALVLSTVRLMGEYAGAETGALNTRVGPHALEILRAMSARVLDRLRAVPRGAVIVEGFIEDPETYEKPLMKVLQAAIEADPRFAQALQDDLARYRAQRRAEPAPTTYRATVKGSGAIAQGPGAVAAGRGGMVIQGHGNVVGDNSSSRAQVGGIRAHRIEAENVVDGAQIRGGTPEDAARLVGLAQAIQRGGITAEEIKAGSVVSGLQFIAGKPPETPAELRDEVAALRAQVAEAVAAGEIRSQGDAEDVTDALDKAEAELAKSDPEGNRVARTLKTASEILTGAAETAQAARNAGWQIVKLAPLAAALCQLAQVIF
jgi:hypothetical protein